MAAISTVLLAAAASEEEETAESILERHMSLVFSGPDTQNPAFACHSAGSSGAQNHGVRVSSDGHAESYTAHRVKSSSLAHSKSAAEGNWSSSDQWSMSDHYLPAFRTSASFGDGVLPQPKIYRPHFSDLGRADRERTMTQTANNSAVSKHHPRHLLSCPHTDADRK